MYPAKAGGATSTLLMLPLKLRNDAGLLPFVVSPPVTTLIRSYSWFCRSIGEIKSLEWSGSLFGCVSGDVGGVGGGEAVDAFGDGVGNFLLSIKKRKGRRRLVYVATAKSF
jgi:hypothetical protein